MSLQDPAPLRIRWSVKLLISRASTFRRMRALQTLLVVLGSTSRTPRSKRLERRPRAPRKYSGPRPVEGKVSAHEPRSRRIRLTRPDFREATLASAGWCPAPSRFCNARGERITLQERFGLSAFRSNGSGLEMRYGFEPPHVSTEAAVRPPFDDEKYVRTTLPFSFTTSPAVACTAAVEPGSSPLP